MKKGIVLPFIIILASIALIISAFFILDNKPKSTSQNPTESASPSPKIDTTNWKMYTNSNFGYSLTYPNDWYVIEPGNDGTKSINIKNYLGSEITEAEKKNVSIGPNKISITVGLYDENIQSNQSLTDFLKATDKWFSAMDGEPTSVEDIKIAGKPALKLNYSRPFYVFSDGENVFYSYFYSYFVPGNSNFLLIFNQILSTFQFLD